MQPPLDEQRFQYPNQETGSLFQAMLTLKSVEECEAFFRDLCTMQELKSMTERWQIARLAWMGFPYRVITAKTGASSTTIARVVHWLTYGKGGYRLACDRLFSSAGQHVSQQAIETLYSAKEVELVSVTNEP